MTGTKFIRVFSLCVALALAFASLCVILLALMRGLDLSEVQHLVSLAGMGIAVAGLLSILVVRWAVGSIRGGFGPKDKGYLQSVAVCFGILFVAFWAFDQARAETGGCFLGAIAVGIAIIVGSFGISQELVPDNKRFALNMSLIAVTWGALAGWGIGFQVVWDQNPAFGALAVTAAIVLAALAALLLSKQEQREDFARAPDAYD